MNVLQWLPPWLTQQPQHPLIVACLILFVGIVASRQLSRFARLLVSRRFSPQDAHLAGRVTYYLGFLLTLFQALNAAGVDLTVLLGAAGILTVAIGFASQTSASNIISGLFLIGERPFVLGDTVQIGMTQGEVISIDLMSVKVRTFDNLLVRLPNSTLLGSEITNLTRFPIRRIDLLIDLPYWQDIKTAENVLFEVAAGLPQCLSEPAPCLQILGFGPSAVNTKLTVWTTTKSFLDVRSKLLIAIKEDFEAHSIDFPYPQMTLSRHPGPASSTRSKDADPGEMSS